GTWRWGAARRPSLRARSRLPWVWAGGPPENLANGDRPAGGRRGPLREPTGQTSSTHGCQHFRAFVGDGDRVLEMGREAPVRGHHRPPVVEQTGLGPAGVHHGLDGEHMAGVEPDAL